jgi:hypothetical protein
MTCIGVSRYEILAGLLERMELQRGNIETLCLKIEKDDSGQVSPRHWQEGPYGLALSPQ